MDADAGAVRDFVDERQEFLESRRVGFLQGVRASRYEEIGVFEGRVGVVGVLERQGDGAVDGVAFAISANQMDGCHCCGIYSGSRCQ